LKNLAKYKNIIRTREYLVQAIFQLLFNDQDADSILKQFKKEHVKKKNVDFAYFNRSLTSISEHQDVIQKNLEDLNIKNSDMELIDKSILYFAINEFKAMELDGPLIIDESLRLSKKFSNPESYKFINTYLDKYLKLQK